MTINNAHIKITELDNVDQLQELIDVYGKDAVEQAQKKVQEDTVEFKRRLSLTNKEKITLYKNLIK